MKALFRVRKNGKATDQIITMEVSSNNEAVVVAGRINTELTPVSGSRIECLGVAGSVQQATDLFELYELAMTGEELRHCRSGRRGDMTVRAAYDQAKQVLV